MKAESWYPKVPTGLLTKEEEDDDSSETGDNLKTLTKESELPVEFNFKESPSPQVTDNLGCLNLRPFMQSDEFVDRSM